MPWHLIAYDIREPRRLQRIQRRVAKQAIPLQYSVYLFEGNHADLNDLLELLDPHLDHQADDLRCYPIPHPNSLWQYGHTLAPNLLTGTPKNAAKTTWRNPINKIRAWLQ